MSSLKDKSDKYLSKIKVLEESLFFTEETNNIIKKTIIEMKYLEELDEKSINNNIDIDNVIRIKCGNTYYKFNIEHNILVTPNDITTYVELDYLINNNRQPIDLSDDKKYYNLIRNIVFLGYIFLRKLNGNIEIDSINYTPPFAQKIINMVLEMNKL